VGIGAAVERPVVLVGLMEVAIGFWFNEILLKIIRNKEGKNLLLPILND
jgi:hypothetical protein